MKALAALSLCLLVSTNAYSWGSKRPSTPAEPTTPTIPTNPEPTGSYIDQIKSIAGSSTCASYSWKSRGRAPAGYVKGMALTYARSYCRYKHSLDTPTNLAALLSKAREMPQQMLLPITHQLFSSLGLQVSKDGAAPLRALYTLGLGLGMRESSGKYCEGRDMAASNTSASTAEAGLFQTSYNSMSSSPELNRIYAEYQNDTSKCFLDTFKQGVSSCGNSNISGTGAGAEYQIFNKTCPAFASEYAMVMLRVRRSHYGPINRKDAEVISSCNQMLQSVQNLIDNDPYACDEVN